MLEKHSLGDALFTAVGEHLQAHGLQLSKGTMVDATLIAASPSTKNATGERDPEMHQTRKGKQWYFGMKIHVGADINSGTAHTVSGVSGMIVPKIRLEGGNNSKMAE